MEEIDIIELLKRVKEGNAPRKIFANGICYQYQDGDIECLYQGHCGENTLWWLDEVTLFTQIQILDKPIIEEMDMINRPWINHAELIPEKINEVIRYINNKENKDE